MFYKIKELLKYTGNVRTFSCFLKKTGKEYNQIELKITSRKIVNRLDVFGIVENKTKNLCFPQVISDLDDEQIIKSFILGVFEGDGSLLFDRKTRSPCFQIVGTKEFLEGIQMHLIKYLGQRKTKLTKNTNISNHYALRYRGRFQFLKIVDWLYSNQDYYLNRKYYQYKKLKSFLQS
jgi:hypothetical protein